MYLPIWTDVTVVRNWPVMVSLVPPDTGPYNGRTLSTDTSLSDTARSTDKRRFTDAAHGHAIAVRLFVQIQLGLYCDLFKLSLMTSVPDQRNFWLTYVIFLLLLHSAAVARKTRLPFVKLSSAVSVLLRWLSFHPVNWLLNVAVTSARPRKVCQKADIRRSGARNFYTIELQGRSH